MEASQISIRIGNCLYQRFFPLYKLLYPAFKKQQDAAEIALIRRLVRPRSHVLDIGANIGFYTSLLSDLIGADGHVHAFEPDATNFKHLSAMAGDRSNVTLVPKAVSDRSGKLLVYTSPKLNVDHRTYEFENYKQAIAVDGVSIDDYLGGGRSRIDFIKMDIQGYELKALRGMEKTIGANPAMVILSEFWPYGFQQCGTSASVVYDYVRSLDLQIWLIERGRLRPVSRKTVRELAEVETVYYNVVLSKQPIVNAQKVEVQV
jgi:FkbM family methyltransferase